MISLTNHDFQWGRYNLPSSNYSCYSEPALPKWLGYLQIQTKPGRRDEELRAVGVGAGVGHAEDTWTRWAKDCEFIWAEVNKHQEKETKYRYCVVCIYIYTRIYIYI